MTSAYKVKVSGETVHVWHFEEELSDRDRALLLWHERASYQVDDVSLDKREPVPGVKAISFREWVVQTMTATEIVPTEEVGNGPIVFPHEDDGEDLSSGYSNRDSIRGGRKGGAPRKYSADQLVFDGLRLADSVPERNWLYTRLDIPDLVGIDTTTEEGRQYAQDYVLRSLKKPISTYVEFGMSALAEVPMMAVWNGNREPTDDDTPEW